MTVTQHVQIFTHAQAWGQIIKHPSGGLGIVT